MKIKEVQKSYLIIIAYVVVGFMIIGAVQLLKRPDWLNASFIILLLFSIENITTAKIFGLNNEIKIFWSLRKIIYLPIGFVIGGLIAITPILIGLITGIISTNELLLNTAFTTSSILITLAIVAWEELWFRGIFLNYCYKNLSPIKISITIGLLFMLVHILNPEINLLKKGPTLFFAGAFLTIAYFYFRTIWLPIGLHFGNNYLSLQTKLENHWLFGNEGYLGAFILAGFFLVLVKLTINKTKRHENKDVHLINALNLHDGKRSKC
jgi:membrane protease YdiL (CAAX protease family)